MYDTVNFWIGREELTASNPFDILPYLSEISERQNEKSGYSCTGKILDYTVNVFECGISLKGSLCKSFFGDNLKTLTRRATQQAVEKVSDNLHMDISKAKVARVDVSTVIPTKRPPADYYNYLGNKPYFERLQSTQDTLYYNNHQRQIIFYDKTKEANAKHVPIPTIWQNCNLLRYELRFTKRLNKQLNNTLKAAILYDEVFYYRIVQSWYNEFKTIQKHNNTEFMTDEINTPKDAETALFAYLLQKEGQSFINNFLADLRAKNVFKERQRYYELKRKLNTIAQKPKGQKSDLIKELETAIFDVAKYAR
jgi:hypothetical protein